MVGGIVMSKNFTITKGDFTFSTASVKIAFTKLEYHYKLAEHLKTNTINLANRFRSVDASIEEKQQLLHKAIDYYLTPTSNERVLGKNVIVFNGKGKQAIILHEEFGSIQQIWLDVLKDAKILPCVKKHMVEAKQSAVYNEQLSLKRACEDCMIKWKEVQQQAAARR